MKLIKKEKNDIILIILKTKSITIEVVCGKSLTI